DRSGLTADVRGVRLIDQVRAALPVSGQRPQDLTGPAAYLLDRDLGGVHVSLQLGQGAADPVMLPDQVPYAAGQAGCLVEQLGVAPVGSLGERDVLGERATQGHETDADAASPAGVPRWSGQGLLEAEDVPQRRGAAAG